MTYLMKGMVLPALYLTIFTIPSAAIKTYAALGDSYATGDGAGSTKLLPNFDFTCGRFDEAYPVQIFNSSKLGIPTSGFKNIACGGASSLSVLHGQVPKIGNSEVVSITVGGNEVDFFALMNACVHEWFPNTPCEQVMKEARALVQSKTFLENFDAMVRGAMKVLYPESKLLVTGYAKFFNESTDQCDQASFSRRNPQNFLTKQLRRDFNQMVSMVNTVVRAAAEAHGATYVDIDELFDGHRFCEEGVVEPAARNDTWFFNMEYSIDQHHDQQNHLDSPKNLREEGDEAQRLLPGPIKDFFDLTRTFHPTGRGHKAIADAIIKLIS